MLRAETYYRYQIMLRIQRMSVLSKKLALVLPGIVLPEDVALSVNIDPTDLG